MMILLVGKAFSVTTCWTGGDGILISVTLCRPLAFSGTIFWIGGDAIEHSTIGKDGKTCSEVTSCICGEGIEQEVMGWAIGGPFRISSISLRIRSTYSL